MAVWSNIGKRARGTGWMGSTFTGLGGMGRRGKRQTAELAALRRAPAGMRGGMSNIRAQRDLQRGIRRRGMRRVGYGGAAGYSMINADASRRRSSGTTGLNGRSSGTTGMYRY